MDYELDLDKVEEFLQKVKPSKVLVEAPPGLPWALEEVCKVVEAFGAECLRSAMPVFGACLVYEFTEADAIVHVGHFPYRWWRPRKPTLFIEARYRGDVRLSPEELSGKRVLLAASAQHVHLLNELKRRLEELGFEAEVGGLVLGCDYSALKRGFDDYVIVAGGLFHAVGASMYLRRPVLKADPYAKNERVDASKIIAKRMWLVSEAFGEKEIAVVDGYEGQSRPNYLKALEKYAEEKGKRLKVYKALILTKEFVLNLPERVVVTLSCPRLALDDFGDVREKVVLAPGEARAALTEDLEKYAFPW